MSAGPNRRGRVPFNSKAGFRQHSAKEQSAVHPALLKQARQSGQLNLSGRNLETVPDSVWRINIDVPEEAKNVSLDNTEDRWWEQTDLTKLILASNRLVGLSDDIRQLPALTVLDLHDNLLTSLPEALGELANLQRLNVSHNKLTDLPKCISELKNLSLFHVAHNELSALPEDVGALFHIEDVDFSHNQLTQLPSSIGYLTRVMKFNVSNNKLSNLPVEIGGMNALRYLDATHNQIHSLPDELGDLGHLETLYLRHNRLTHLPILEHCTGVKELHVGNNAIMGLTPEHLQHMKHISFLDLRDNRLATIPVEITMLTDLERIDLTNNDLSGLPYEMGNMQKLKAIVLDGNPMKSIRRDIIMRGTNEIKKYLRSRITEPEPSRPGSGNQKGVKSHQGSSGIIGGGDDKVDAHEVNITKALDYSNKNSQSVPADVWQLAVDSGITTVNLSKNTFTQLPENLVLTVDTLEDLNIGFNKLNSLSPDISLFLKLVSLDLRNNLLSGLPQELTSLQNLKFVTLSCNRFKQIPPVLYDLPKLESILASDNQINVIDASGLQRLEMLAVLDLSNNDIMQVPPELGLCQALRALQLGGNPFRNPRPAILAKGTPALLDYLKGRIPT